MPENIVADNENAPQQVVINSKTSGRIRRKKINGRDHLMTSMMPIAGDTVMNKILYPLEEVSNSFRQLDNLPAPAGHPVVDGVMVPASSPLGVNAHNIGGFVKRPRMEGVRVVVDFLLDVKVAQNSDDGKRTIERLENNERLEVSTGLFMHLDEGAGVGDGGMEYNHVGRDYQFDHVAVLLDEPAAGRHAGTEIVYNKAEEKILFCSVADEEEENNDEGTDMTTEEMVAALNQEGHTVLPPNDSRLTRLEISDAEYAAFNAHKQEKAEALNVLRAKAGEILGRNAEELSDWPEDAIQAVVNQAEAAAESIATAASHEDDSSDEGEGEEPKPMRNALRAGNGGMVATNNDGGVAAIHKEIEGS